MERPKKMNQRRFIGFIDRRNEINRGKSTTKSTFIIILVTGKRQIIYE